MKMPIQMHNVQVTMFNECQNVQWVNALNHYSNDHSLSIEHCPLSIQGALHE